MHKTVAFSKNSANIFFHILTQCNLNCQHCYVNPAQHGTQKLSSARIRTWLETLAQRSLGANLIFLGGEPTLHPGLAQAVKDARSLGYASITIDTNGYLFNDILEHVTPTEIDFFSFSLDGAVAATNDPIRGQGCFNTCTKGIRAAKAKGFNTSLIFTVSSLNLDELPCMIPLLQALRIDHFFIQFIGLRGKSAAESHLQISRHQWLEKVPPVAEQIANLGICVTYPKVYLSPDEPFTCAGRIADNYFIFPNGRVYRCPLCEDYPLHGFSFTEDKLVTTDPINETNLFQLEIAEGCVMNKLIQPQNLTYDQNGQPKYKIACCLLKEEIKP